MKLLVLANTAIWGGAEVFLFRLCRELCRSGIEVVVVCPQDGPLYDRFRELPLAACYQAEMGIPAGRWRGLGSLTLLAPWKLGGMRQLLSDMQQRHGCDTVLCQYPREQVLTAELAETTGYRTIWMSHSELFYWLHRLVTNRMLRRWLPEAHRAYVFSRSTQQRLVRQGFPERSLRVLPEGMDAPGLLPERSGGDRLRIGVLSRLDHVKGVQVTLRATVEIIAKLPTVEVLVAGTGRYEASLRKLARRLNIESNVRFLGFLRNPWELLSQVDVLCHPTFDVGDSMPIAILEAAVARVPAVSTRWNGIPEIVRHEETGILVPVHDTKAVAEALMCLLQDRGFRLRMGDAARRFVLSNFTMATITKRWLEDLNQTVSAAPTEFCARSRTVEVNP